MTPRPAAPFLPAALACLLPALAAGQTLPCEARNDANTTVTTSITAYGFGGPNTNAWQIIPAGASVVLGVRLFTGNTQLSGDRYMTVEIWDDLGGLPNQRLGGGTWKISAALGTAWQGANLDAPVVLNTGTPVWIVWIDPGFSTPPVEPGGATGPTATRSGGTWNLALTDAAPKVRLFCSLLDDTGVTPFGPFCAASTGRIGTLFANRAPAVGNADFAFEGSGFGAGALTILVFGFDPTFTSAALPELPAGCALNTDVVAATFGLAGAGNVRGPAADGHVFAPLGIPAAPALVGTFLAAQLAGNDPGLAAPLPFSTSNALRIVVL